MVIKEVSQSYLTRLWNRDDWKQEKRDDERSFVHLVSRYFTWVVFSIATVAAIYWAFNDSSKIWNSITAVLIIACPCALLLANTFTNGYILRIVGGKKLFLRNAQTIEAIATADHIVFDKTGTLTTGAYNDIEYIGRPLTDLEQKKIVSLAYQSAHPMSKAVVAYLNKRPAFNAYCFVERPGMGIEGIVDGDLISLGSKQFVTHTKDTADETAVYLSIEEKVAGKFIFRNHYRDHIFQMVSQLQKHYPISILSGDNAGEKKFLQHMIGSDADIRFRQMPHDKLDTIEKLQQQGRQVIMLGDGLNDAGALQQADVGIAVSESSNNFTPASDAILSAENLPLLYQFIWLCKINKKIVVASFIISILYNLVGLFFAVQGTLAPVIAAILMPASSISILLITFGSSSLAAKSLGLK